MMQAPVVVLNASTRREIGRKAQLGNIAAAKTVADIIRTTLGPRAMLKMLLDPMGGIVITNDGNAILREIDVSHPAAKTMIELSRTQDEEVGDGTTSVVILAGELLYVAEPFLEKNFHPTVICRAYSQAMEDALEIMDQMASPLDVHNKPQILGVINSCIATKFTNRFGTLMADLALEAVKIVCADLTTLGGQQVDLKNYAKVEKVPGGKIEDSRVLSGVMFNKDVVTPGKMSRRIASPRIILLDSSLEYKKGENMTNVELTKEEDWAALLKQEEDHIAELCEGLARFRPDLVITEKGLSDLAAHFLAKAGISAIRRVKKTDNNRIAKATGATIVNRIDELTEKDVGKGAGLFEVQKIGDEYFTFIVGCRDPQACTILLRGPSMDVLKEVERNLQDALCIARNVVRYPKLLPGGGATETSVAVALRKKADTVAGVEQWPYRAVADALEVIPRTIANNCGVSVIRTMTALQAKHAGGENTTFGIDGLTGKIVDMKDLGIWEPAVVKTQTLKTAIEAACMLLRIDDIVSGLKKNKAGGGGGPQSTPIGGDDEIDSEAALPE